MQLGRCLLIREAVMSLQLHVAGLKAGLLAHIAVASIFTVVLNTHAQTIKVVASSWHGTAW